LESLSSIGLDLFFNNLDKISIKFVLEVARAIASTARESFLVDFGAIAFEADYAFLI
jgi:hypothetical protein